MKSRLRWNKSGLPEFFWLHQFCRRGSCFWICRVTSHHKAKKNGVAAPHMYTCTIIFCAIIMQIFFPKVTTTHCKMHLNQKTSLLTGPFKQSTDDYIFTLPAVDTRWQHRQWLLKCSSRIWHSFYSVVPLKELRHWY